MALKQPKTETKRREKKMTLVFKVGSYRTGVDRTEDPGIGQGETEKGTMIPRRSCSRTSLCPML